MFLFKRKKKDYQYSEQNQFKPLSLSEKSDLLMNITEGKNYNELSDSQYSQIIQLNLDDLFIETEKFKYKNDIDPTTKHYKPLVQHSLNDDPNDWKAALREEPKNDPISKLKDKLFLQLNEIYNENPNIIGIIQSKIQ